MKLGLEEKVALVVSIHSGVCIALESAWTLTEEGAKVIVSDPNPKAISMIKEGVKKETGKEIFGYSFDIYKEREMKKFLKILENKFGRVDILLCDCGMTEFIPHLKYFLDLKRKEWQRVVRIVFESILIWTKAIAPIMMKNRYGRIIYITSESAKISSPKLSIYGGCKAAVAAFARSFAAEVSRYNITVNCVSVGAQAVEKRNGFSEEVMESLGKLVKRIPIKRFGEPEDVVSMAVFLASEHASYITGQHISVSGGMSMS